MSKVLILVNHDTAITYLRMELLNRLLSEGHTVAIACPRGKHVDTFMDMGCEFYELTLKRHGINPFHELTLLSDYYKLIKRIKPQAVLSFSIKPNIYGGLAAAMCNVPCFSNVTGLGITIQSKHIVSFITKPLYKLGLSKAKTVFVQNTDNLAFLQKKRMVSDNYHLLPGSGVNLNRFPYVPYPEDDEILRLLVVGRITRDKGIGEILAAAKILQNRGKKVKIRLLGYYDEDYQREVEVAVQTTCIEYCGYQEDVQPYLADCHALLHASYHEGMANALLEAASTGRPILATRIPGCREAFDEGISGLGFDVKNPESLCAAVEKFIALPREKREEMGKRGREKMEREFDRTIVIDAYMEELSAVL
ncbi:MAG: glycosyltransferase family 4 protein [Ruminococcaceae bacterium]|nr:glycosyltransferase family 4 protein [Oscillospiraceae bacterium]